MSEWPEHDKLKAHQDEAFIIGRFLEWLEDNQKVRLCTPAFENDEGGVVWWPTQVPIERTLARYFRIDLTAIDREKRAMLELIRAKNDNRTFGLEPAGAPRG